MTDKTREFCSRHDEGSKAIVGKIFEGIDPKQVAITIKTIMQMERNLEKVGEK